MTKEIYQQLKTARRPDLKINTDSDQHKSSPLMNVPCILSSHAEYRGTFKGLSCLFPSLQKKLEEATVERGEWLTRSYLAVLRNT